jgi:hypothetical protein
MRSIVSPLDGFQSPFGRRAGAPAPFSGVLDALGVSPAAAFSMRRLSSAHTGPLMRVRRSSDNAEADIGFTLPGAMDEAALLTHCGAGNGFVVTWYDQSGNNRHFSQAVAAAQPRIVTDGVVNEAPAYDGLDDTLVAASADWGNSAAFTCFAVARRTTTLAGSRSIWGNRDSVGGRLFRYANFAGYLAQGGSSPGVLAIVNGQQYVFSTISDPGNTVNYRIDNDRQSTASGTSYVPSSGVPFRVGSAGVIGPEFFLGTVSELLVFDEAVSNENRVALDRNLGAAFGIAVA